MVGKLVYGSANTTYTNSYYSPTKDIYANSSSKNKDYDSDDDMDT
jgi:hypothetical protein